MKLSSPTPAARTRPGFTLAEVAVSIVIVGMGLIWILEGMNLAKLTAAHTRNYKLARELAMVTLGQIESGQFQEDIASGLTGTYAEEGYPDFIYEVIVGDETFREKKDDGTFDSWAPRDSSTTRNSSSSSDSSSTDSEDKQDEEQPFERVKIKVTFPKIREFTNELILEQWMPWKQVYGEKQEDQPPADPNATPGTSGSTPNGSSTTNTNTDTGRSK